MIHYKMDIKSYEKFSVGRIITIISKLSRENEKDDIEEIDLSEEETTASLEAMLSFI